MYNVHQSSGKFPETIFKQSDKLIDLYDELYEHFCSTEFKKLSDPESQAKIRFLFQIAEKSD